MSHVFQVGAGSGGIVALDLLTRDPRITAVTLVEPDVYKPHNVHRHVFPPSVVGRPKGELAAAWVRERRPDMTITLLDADLTDPAMCSTFEKHAAGCDVGLCAVDNEPAKYAFDELMRTVDKPWTLGEVLSGGIGGWVHRFTPDGPCYGCVSSHLQRTVTEEPRAPVPDYSDPHAAVVETTVPASKASIEVIAALHAAITLELLDTHCPDPSPKRGGEEDRSSSAPPSLSGKGVGGLGSSDEFTSLLFTLRRVPGVFEDAFRTFRFQIPRSAACLFCSAVPAPTAGEDLDVALDQALGRLGHD
jgi:molybdopterin/thiamine biosynthesis adenylyltransferase